MVRVFVAALSIVAASCAGDPPVTTPSPVPARGEPARLELSATPGVGEHGGTARVQARVQDAFGATLPDVAVTFSADAGAFDAATASTDQNGVAVAALTADPGAVKVRAAAGALSPTETTVVIQPRNVATPLPPLPPPPPEQGPPVVPFTVSIVTNVAPVSNATVFGLSVSAPVAAAAWTFGDGATGSSGGTVVTVSHVYTLTNSYPVTVTATDTRGRTAAASTTVTIPAAAYTVSLAAAPAAAATGANVVLTATVTPVGAPAVTAWTWDCDTSTPSTDFTTATTATCVYPLAGTFTARVTVSGGSVTGTATTTVTVTPAVPVIVVHCAQPTPAALTENCNVTATLNGAPVATPNITSVDWDFGDGTPITTTTTSVAPSHVYAAANTYTVFARNVTVTGTTGQGTGSLNVDVK